MKRVKTASPTPEKTVHSEPPSMTSSLQGSLTPSGSTSNFKSPLLQGIMGSKLSQGDNSEKKFSSSLLNNIMGECYRHRVILH